MTKIIKLEDDELNYFRKAMRHVVEADADEVYRVRVAIDGDEFKFKVNGGAWSPGMGVVEVTTLTRAENFINEIAELGDVNSDSECWEILHRLIGSAKEICRDLQIGASQ